jgi:hypothetical protein
MKIDEVVETLDCDMQCLHGSQALQEEIIRDHDAAQHAHEWHFRRLGWEEA